MRRARPLLAVVLLGLVAGTLPPAAAQEGLPPPPAVADRLRVRSVLPPGQNGNVTAVDFARFQADAGFPEHYADQLDMYMGLVDDPKVTRSDLGRHFHSEQFGPEQIARSYEPREGVRVYRDALGVPHVYGDTVEDVEFALGYVTAEDRLWQADVFRHAAHGRLAEFAGPDFMAMDREIRRNGYTGEELQAQLDRLPRKFPRLGPLILRSLQAYADGFNAYVEELLQHPQDIPAEYAATLNVPQPDWEPVDTAALVVLQLREFGETAGDEMRLAALLERLIERLGPKAGRRAFDDLRRINDPASPTSIARADGTFDSQQLPRPDPRAIAIPDDAAQAAGFAARQERALADGLRSIGFPVLGEPASNALLVTASASATGHPMQTGGPQVGYSVPQFFMDIDAHGGDGRNRLDFRGPAVPGASLLVPLGRGIDYSWTLTTGFSDAVDIRAERLCEPDGSEPTTESKHYLFRGRCIAMQVRTETIIGKPTAGDRQAPRVETLEIDRTRHGPVFLRTTVGGKPVAFVKQRLFWMRELDSVAAFTQWNSPSEVRTIHDFFRAGDKMTVSFNVFAAFPKHVGYWHVGEYPLRAPGVDPRLPSWGTGAWEWRGVSNYSKQPHVIDPSQGWVVNWNNKPSTGWNHGDDSDWGPVQRVSLLQRGMRERLAGGRKIDAPGLVDVMRRAATQDIDAIRLMPLMSREVTGAFARGGPGDAGRLDRARDLVVAWVRDGGHRVDHDHDGNDDRPVPTLVFDAWFQNLARRMFGDELGAEERRDFSIAGVDLHDAPQFNNGSSYFADFANHVWRQLARPGQFSRNYCDDIRTKRREGCRAHVVGALRDALAEVAEDQGTADMSKWTRPADVIEHEAQGAGSVPDIPWQNRGTFNQIVEVLGPRP